MCSKVDAVLHAIDSVGVRLMVHCYAPRVLMIACSKIRQHNTWHPSKRYRALAGLVPEDIGGTLLYVAVWCNS